MTISSVNFLKIKSESVSLLDNADDYIVIVRASTLFSHCCKLYRYVIALINIFNW